MSPDPLDPMRPHTESPPKLLGDESPTSREAKRPEEGTMLSEPHSSDGAAIVQNQIITLENKLRTLQEAHHQHDYFVNGHLIVHVLEATDLAPTTAASTNAQTHGSASAMSPAESRSFCVTARMNKKKFETKKVKGYVLHSDMVFDFGGVRLGAALRAHICFVLGLGTSLFTRSFILTSSPLPLSPFSH